MQYELFYLIGSSKEAELEKIKENIIKMIEAAGGKFSEKEVIEKRRLSYQVKHETHGIYVARRFEIEPEKITDLTRELNLHPDCLRFLISRADELPELKSKEERAGEARVEKPAVKIKKPLETKSVSTRKEAGPEEKVAKKEEKGKGEISQDEIDKKLEEILNI